MVSNDYRSKEWMLLKKPWMLAFRKFPPSIPKKLNLHSPLPSIHFPTLKNGSFFAPPQSWESFPGERIKLIS